jgi:hypothetical protein
MRAARQLAHVRSVLGTVGYDLCRSVIAGGLIMEQVAAAAGNSSQRSIDFWARRFRECLQTLANTICRVCLDFGRARRRAAS